ncbi:MAG: type II toxin-antitoxin system RatA family toxin [Alphaproteobacteria bacterium]|nr:type II toxin-antitoxin system RatA family toxin [Alphaproteobacteria bacterium]
MPAHSEQKFLPYTAQQIYDLVADIDKYPEFLPWCVASRVKSRVADSNGGGAVVLADLVIGYKLIQERFTSRVILQPHQRIEVNYTEGPFKYLNNIWQFNAQNGGCLVDFAIDFEFKSRLLQKMIEPFFYEAVRRMVTAFELRANKLYGGGK